MELKDYPALRPKDQGSRFKTMTIESNLYKYKGEYKEFHEYKVTFQPEIHRKLVWDTFMRGMEKKSEIMPHIAFDGINLLVSKERFSNFTIEIPAIKPIKMYVEYKNTYDLNDAKKDVDLSQHIQCMEAITRYNQRREFCSDGAVVYGLKYDGSLGVGLEIRVGLLHMMKVTVRGLFLNVNLSFGVFYKQMPLLSLITEIYESQQNKANFSDNRGGYDRNNHNRGRGEYQNKRINIDLSVDDLGRNFYNDLEKFLRNTRVRTTHRSPNARELVFKVSEIQQQPASSIKFEINGESTNVADYFAKTYKPLKYPNLPVVVVRKKGMALHFPLEVLEIFPGQKYMKKLDEDQTSSMIRWAAIPPVDRFKSISKKAEEFKVLNNPVDKVFGMAFEGEFTKCTGQLLPSPRVQYANNVDARIQRGSWNLRDVEAVKPVTIDNWMFIAFRGREGDFARGIDCLKDLGRKFGVRFTKSPKVVVVRSADEFFRMQKEPFCLVILPDKSSARYCEIKRVCETSNEIVTQCVLNKNVRSLTNPAFVGNLLLKINAKLGGVNSKLAQAPSIMNEPTLVIGIDVNHPGGADIESPSIVGVVGSMDKDLATYKTIIKQQERRKEIVDGLKDIVTDMLRSFYSKNRTKPKQIVIFRDGVGESMFQTVFHTEIMQVKQACASMEQGYNPKILFIVAQKRHSVRFNNPASATERGQNGNVPPGTVVEDIGHPVLFDFYLVSHHALQGTARPVRYLVLLDEIKMKKEEIYNFIYGMCHLYARATKVVSVVPPIYYAHLAAARGKAYLCKDERSHKLVMKQNSKTFGDKLFYL